MREETPEENKNLRRGYSTGACATAACFAAAIRLFNNDAASKIDNVDITLPRGEVVTFQLDYCRRIENRAEAGTIKDAGDDPDVTHGSLIYASVEFKAQPGVSFVAGEGVGKVTCKGLPVAIGEPAINPVPRQMIVNHLSALAKVKNYSGGFIVTISVKNGEVLAKKTLNERLGIIGGLSILGTTGIVRPYSCSAYIASIHSAIDVAHANGIERVVGCTGQTSETFAKKTFQLPDMAYIEMGDFVGAFLKYARNRGFSKIILVGGFGKLCKLASGHLNLHSSASTINFDYLSNQARLCGATLDLASKIESANTSAEVLTMCQQNNINIGDRVCQLASDEIRRHMSGSDIQIIAVDRNGEGVGRSST